MPQKTGLKLSGKYNFFIANSFYADGFGEGLRLATDRLNSKNFYAFNPEFER